MTKLSNINREVNRRMLRPFNELMTHVGPQNYDTKTIPVDFIETRKALIEQNPASKHKVTRYRQNMVE